MISVQNITKKFKARHGTILALDQVNLNITPGEFVSVCGPSGSGKTTLLMTIAGMQHPSSGTVTIDGRQIYLMTSGARAAFRAQTIGFIFQMFHLVPYLNVIENIELARPNPSEPDRHARIDEMLENLGLTQRRHHRPPQLSAGEKQRVALARALINNPPIVLADEPTGNLDDENAHIVLQQMRTFHRNGGTVVLVTHGGQVEQFADRVIHLQQGQIR